MAAGHWAELAWHWSSARDTANAFEASVHAADSATRAFAFADAQRHGERALEMWPSVADAEARAGTDKAAFLDLVAQAAWLASDSRRAVALRRAAVAELQEAEPLRLGIAQERLGRALWYHGDTEAALEAHEEAIALIPEDPPTPELARVLAGYGQILMLLDQWAEAVEVLTRAVDIARAVKGVTQIQTEIRLSDAGLTEEVKKAVAADASVNQVPLRIEVKDAQVKLYSDQTNADQRAKLRDIAGGVPGVAGVEDNMK